MSTLRLSCLVVVLAGMSAEAQSFTFGPQQCSTDGNLARIAIDAVLTKPVSCPGGYCQLPPIKVDFQDCYGGTVGFGVGAIVITGYQFQSQVHQAVSDFRIDLSNQVLLRSGSATRLAVQPTVRWLDSSGATDDMSLWLHLEAVATKKSAINMKKVPMMCESTTANCESSFDASGIGGVKTWLGMTRMVVNSTHAYGWAYADRFSFRTWYSAGSDQLRLSCGLDDAAHPGLSCDSESVLMAAASTYSPYWLSAFGYLSFNQSIFQTQDRITLSQSYPLVQFAAVNTCGWEGFQFDSSTFPSYSKAYAIWAGAHASSCVQSSSTTFKFDATGALQTYSLPGPPDVLYDLAGMVPAQYTVSLAPARAR